MLASFLGCITPRHRAWAFALLGLLALTIVNVQTGGTFRSTVLFAIPVAVVAWTDWQLGFVFAAASVLCAKFGGAIPEPGSPSPLWLDGMLASIKLSIDAAAAHAWGRQFRRRAENVRESEELRHRSGT